MQYFQMTNLLRGRFVSLVSALSRYDSLPVLLSFFLLGEEESKEIPLEVREKSNTQVRDPQWLDQGPSKTQKH